MRYGAAAVAAAALCAACSGSGGTDPSVSPRPSTTCNLGAPTVPGNCLPETLPTGASGFGPVGQLPAIPPQPVPTELAADGSPTLLTTTLASASNATNPALRTARLTVTVLAGSSLGSDVVCLGPGSVTVETTPASNAFQQVTCNADRTTPSEGGPAVGDPVGTTTRFTVAVTVGADTRWSATVFSAVQK